tara:strand:- start:1886 stop:2353 length:468 start_codon:yes stop_codon:yes gene_type:complete
MAVTTLTANGLSIYYKTEEVSAISIDLDLDMRTGTPVDSQEWLKGFGTQYPGGGLDEFGASNSEGAAEGSLRLLNLSFTLATADAEVIVFSAGVSKIVGILGGSLAVADKTLSLATTATGDATADPPAKTGGALPALELHAEGAGAGTVSLLVLN